MVNELSGSACLARKLKALTTSKSTRRGASSILVARRRAETDTVYLSFSYIYKKRKIYYKKQNHLSEFDFF